jgi:hypothetical protein
MFQKATGGVEAEAESGEERQAASSLPTSGSNGGGPSKESFEKMMSDLYDDKEASVVTDYSRQAMSKRRVSSKKRSASSVSRVVTGVPNPSDDEADGQRGEFDDRSFSVAMSDGAGNTSSASAKPQKRRVSYPFGPGVDASSVARRDVEHYVLNSIQVCTLSLPSVSTLAKQVIVPLVTKFSTPYTLNSICPGWLVNAKVEALAKNGVCITYLNNVFRGAIKLGHLGANFVPTIRETSQEWRDFFDKQHHCQK